MYDLHGKALAHLAARGIDHDEGDPPDPPAFDPIAYRREQAETALSRHLPARFAHAQADHPGVTAWVRRHLANPAGTPNLLLIGRTGTGKTHQAYGALRALALGVANRGQILTWRATTHPTLNADLRPQPDNEHLVAHERYCAADVLLIDDLGAGKTTDWTGDSLHRLVDHRWANQLPTIATSNLAAAALRVALGDRIASRFADGTVIALHGEDRRRTGTP